MNPIFGVNIKMKDETLFHKKRMTKKRRYEIFEIELLIWFKNVSQQYSFFLFSIYRKNEVMSLSDVFLCRIGAKLATIKRFNIHMCSKCAHAELCERQ